MNTKSKPQASVLDFLWFPAMIGGMAMIFSGNDFGWLLVLPCLSNLK